ncbi:MAG: ATP-dependent DNA helicase RecG [Erysipelotrichaceae bacterium]
MNLNELKLTDRRKEICQRLNLNDSHDILHYYPYRYENYQIIPYKNFKEGMNVFFEGELLSSPYVYRYGSKRSVTRFKVLYEEEELFITIYNRPWVNNLRTGSKIIIHGKYEGKNNVTAMNYYLKNIDEVMGIKAFYSLKEGISNNDIEKIVSIVLNKARDEESDDIPEYFKEKHKLLSLKEALINIHRPIDEMSLRKALSRLKYEEFLNFYSCLFYLKKSDNTDIDYSKNFDDIKVQEFMASFPFEFTKDQNTAISEILNDLKSKKPMDRLLEGEVGSGKTAVAEVACYAAFLSGYQSALMAPTEILAYQHYQDFKKRMKDVNIELLSSSAENKEEIKNRIRNGEADIVIGTHSLFYEDVVFKNLGLVIADEQQRFGVNQRKLLRQKGEKCDLLLMSATPIPRTLASAVYGDKDVSIIETLPKGRKGCRTYLLKKNSIADKLDEVKQELKKGRQVYIVCASIDKNDEYKAKDVNGIYKSLVNVLKPYSLGLLHGKMSAEDKSQVMNDFADNKINVLVCTTVVEVGISVANATMMIVYDADRFGLSQLHQLRGRVQRGDIEGTCYLLSDCKDDKVIERLNVLCKTNNGFEIASEDLRLRGPGDMLGTRQSGLPAFVLGNIVEDTKFIEAAKKDAREIMERPEDFKDYLEKITKMASNLDTD